MAGAVMMLCGGFSADARGALPSSPAVPMLVVERIPQVDEEAPNFLLRDSEGFNVTLDPFLFCTMPISASGFSMAHASSP